MIHSRKDNETENALKAKEADALDSRFNVSLSDSHCNSPGVTFLLVHTWNFTMCRNQETLEIKLSRFSSGVRGMYISGLCIRLPKDKHAFCRTKSIYRINFCIHIIYFSVSSYFCFSKDSKAFFFS